MEREYHDAMTAVLCIRTYLEQGGTNLEEVRKLAYLKTEPLKPFRPQPTRGMAPQNPATLGLGDEQ